MDDIILMSKSKDLDELSKNLGFTAPLWKEGITFIDGTNKKNILDQAKQGRNKKQFVIYQSSQEDTLRFVLERVPVDLIVGMENNHPRDSVHYLRSGLDQIICRIAAEKGMIVGFSFHHILTAPDRAKLLARMKFNLSLCRKYKLKTLFGNFSLQKEELRSKKDLAAFQKVVQRS